MRLGCNLMYPYSKRFEVKMDRLEPKLSRDSTNESWPFAAKVWLRK
jgi:hypothetical protein